MQDLGQYSIYSLFICKNWDNMTHLAAFNMQELGQYSINTEGSTSLQLKVSMKDLYPRVTVFLWL